MSMDTSGRQTSTFKQIWLAVDAFKQITYLNPATEESVFIYPVFKHSHVTKCFQEVVAPLIADANIKPENMVDTRLDDPGAYGRSVTRQPQQASDHPVVLTWGFQPQSDLPDVIGIIFIRITQGELEQGLSWDFGPHKPEDTWWYHQRTRPNRIDNHKVSHARAVAIIRSLASEFASLQTANVH